MRQLLRSVFICMCAALICSCGTSTDRYPREEIEASCKSNYVRIDKKLEVTDLYIDRTYLRILLNPYGESYDLYEVVKFFFAKKLKAIETTNRDEHGNTLVYAYPINPNEKIIRLSIKPLGHPACERYEYPNRYPAQALPWLRKLGLAAENCVGIELLPAPHAEFSINVQEQVIGRQFNGRHWQKRINVTLVDSTASEPVLAASMIDHYSQGGGGKAGIHHGFPCSTRDSQVKAFRSAFDVKSNADIRPPKFIHLPSYDVATSYPMADEKWLNTIQWITKPGENWSSNIINTEGTVWVEQSPSEHQILYTFNTFSDENIFSSPILIPGVGFTETTGLAKTPKGYALIVSRGRDAEKPRYIVEFDTRGKNISTKIISEDQYKKFAIKK